MSEQVEVGQRLTARLREAQVPVTIAFWNQPDEGGRWTLCIATPIADRDGPSAAYRAVLRVKNAVDPEFILGASDVTVIGDMHPIVQDLLKLQRQHPTRLQAGGKPLVVTGVALSNPSPHALTLSPAGTVSTGF